MSPIVAFRSIARHTPCTMRSVSDETNENIGFRRPPFITIRVRHYDVPYRFERETYARQRCETNREARCVVLAVVFGRMRFRSDKFAVPRNAKKILILLISDIFYEQFISLVYRWGSHTMPRSTVDLSM